jgi:cytidine deaminase
VDELNPLVARAREVALRAYAPYSRFRVGAAVTDSSGTVHVGCNVEAASYGLSICAERSAIFAAISAGAARPFTALAVSCIDATHANGCSPCGACRQVMFEHLASDAVIYVDGVGQFTVVELLPHAFELKAGATIGRTSGVEN